MPLPLTVSCFSKIQIGFTFLVPAHPGSPGKGPLNVCVCVRVLWQVFRTIAILEDYMDQYNGCTSEPPHSPRTHVNKALQRLNHLSYILYAWFPEVRR